MPNCHLSFCLILLWIGINKFSMWFFTWIIYLGATVVAFSSVSREMETSGKYFPERLFSIRNLSKMNHTGIKDKLHRILPMFEWLWLKIMVLWYDGLLLSTCQVPITPHGFLPPRSRTTLFAINVIIFIGSVELNINGHDHL